MTTLPSLLENNGIGVILQDERGSGNKIIAKFTGVLRKDQREAVKATLAHDIGVLHVPTAFGKTVVAAAIIAKRKMSTLVLTHRAELLRQCLYHSIKIIIAFPGLKLPLLVELVVFLLRMGKGKLVGDLARVGQDIAFVQGQEGVRAGYPVFHVHGGAASGLPFGKEQVLFHQIVQSEQFFFIQVILGNAHILLANFSAAPCGQAQIRLGAVRPAMDISDAVCPVTAQCSLFCTVLKR